VLYDPLNEVRQHGANTRLVDRVRYRVEITTACDQKGRRRQWGRNASKVRNIVRGSFKQTFGLYRDAEADFHGESRRKWDAHE